jgi:hypothetical protein
MKSNLPAIRGLNVYFFTPGKNAIMTGCYITTARYRGAGSNLQTGEHHDLCRYRKLHKMQVY